MGNVFTSRRRGQGLDGRRLRMAAGVSGGRNGAAFFLLPAGRYVSAISNADFYGEVVMIKGEVTWGHGARLLGARQRLDTNGHVTGVSAFHPAATASPCYRVHSFAGLTLYARDLLLAPEPQQYDCGNMRHELVTTRRR